MAKIPDLHATTKLLADKSRLYMLSNLMDGRFHAVHELSKLAKITDQTASYHLSKMLELDWLESFRQGKFSYYRLKNEVLAELMELLMNMSPNVETRSYNQHHERELLSTGRTCYQHLAGKIGVEFFDFLLSSNLMTVLDGQIFLTAAGEAYFKGLGIDLIKVKSQSGIFAKPCMDWTERRFHLAGNLGKSLLKIFEEKNLIERNPENRAVKWTDKGCDFAAANYRFPVKNDIIFSWKI